VNPLLIEKPYGQSNVRFLHNPHAAKRIAESRPAERETMLSLVMTFLAEDGQGGGHG